VKSQETKSRRRWGWHLPATALVAVILSVAPAVNASANTRIEVPTEGPGLPAYARIGPDAVHTDEWAAIPFYRDPSCVPADFNLLSFIDAPRAFSCPLTVEGFEVWENGPGIDRAPLHAVTREADAVPVWFVSWPELQAAMADGRLTITELAALPSLVVGSADQYQEVLHPNEMIHLNATGTLSDGRAFQVHGTCRCGETASGSHPVVRIRMG